MQTPLIKQVESGVTALLMPLSMAGFEFPQTTSSNPLAFASDVEELPETKEGLQEALLKPRVTVAYRQSTFGTDKENTFSAGLVNVVAQEETLHVDILVRAKGRKSDAGVYVVIQAVRDLLLGAVPSPGMLGLWFTGQQLDDFEDRGTWRYMLSVATSTTIVSGFTFPDEVVERVLLAFNLPPAP